jgi:hypothetical protein
VENEINEFFAYLMILNGSTITAFVTSLDKGMQEQAFLTEQLWLTSPNNSRGIISTLWAENYDLSLQRMRQAITTLKFITGSEPLIQTIEQIIHNIITCQNTRETIASFCFIKNN